MRSWATSISRECHLPIERELALNVLEKHKKAIGWTIVDVKHISLTLCQHKLWLEEGKKPIVDAQRRLNPIVKEVAKRN
ncbi:Transposon Ty3-G Gag-Pol polyprotein [Gossypium australe]|uniref:Transposon Ty3-G Gag-Pol polyprotein n=1 Tax=Gossypium australe TaxID=47621 RepID=A0A5B6WR50_9ROSI|nr:Transposon Ty3-G Gag-Pol polyprotein [Gossypium australe]